LREEQKRSTQSRRSGIRTAAASRTDCFDPRRLRAPIAFRRQYIRPIAPVRIGVLANGNLPSRNGASGV
jgi:hypothetical protein